MKGVALVSVVDVRKQTLNSWSDVYFYVSRFRNVTATTVNVSVGKGAMIPIEKTGILHL
jgi:hypothetical protein